MNLSILRKLAWATIGIFASFLIPMVASAVDNPTVILQTNQGQIEITLLPDKAPLTVRNFLELVQQRHYDGLIFHRVIANFMIQAGGFTSELEFRDSRKRVKNESDNMLSNSRGTVAMARTSDPDSASAQFYINVKDNNHLDYKDGIQGYTVFGFVSQGMPIVDQMELVDTNIQKGMPAVPIEPLVIKSIRNR